MKNRIALALVAAAGFAGVANAQTITQSWRAVVVPASYTYDGVAFPASGGSLDVNPGQAVLFVFSASFTPNAGTALAGNTVRGIGATLTSLSNSSNAAGSYGPLTAGGDAGIASVNIGDNGHIINATSAVTVNAGGISGLGIIAAGPLSGSGGLTSGITADQATDALAILWTPSNYSARTVSFNSAAAGAAGDNFLWVRQGTSGSVGIAVNATVSGSSSFSVNIVPAPASAALLGLGGLVAARRRRA